MSGWSPHRFLQLNLITNFCNEWFQHLTWRRVHLIQTLLSRPTLQPGTSRVCKGKAWFQLTNCIRILVVRVYQRILWFLIVPENPYLLKGRSDTGQIRVRYGIDTGWRAVRQKDRSPWQYIKRTLDSFQMKHQTLKKQVLGAAWNVMTVRLDSRGLIVKNSYRSGL